MRRGTPSAGLLVAVAVALIAPLIAAAAWVFVASSESPLESASEVEPLLGTIEPADRFQQAQVAIAIEEAAEYTPATNAAGVVTEVRVEPGDEVGTGTVLGEVNEAKLVAYASGSPLYRDIYRGLKGSDVASAQRVLAELGYYRGKIDGDSGPATEAAIKRFNKKYGYGSDNGYLSLGSLVWVGTEPVGVAEVRLQLGASVSPGAEVFATSTGLAAVTVSETPNLPRDGEIELVINGVSAPYVAGSGRVVDPEFVAAVAETLGTATEGVGTVQLVTPVTVGTLPSSAVVTDPAGGTCIFASVDSGPTAITPLGGSLGTVEVDASLAGTPVLINPRAVREDLSCG